MKTSRIFIVVFQCLFFLSCSDDFIELAPISSINAKNFYNTEEDIATAVNGAYSALQLSGSYGVSLAEIPEMRSDNAGVSWRQGGSEIDNIIEFKIQTVNSIITRIWSDGYKGILRCNVVLDNIHKVKSLPEAIRSRYEAEVKFIRALIYFNLVRLYGDLPIVLKELKSVEESYNYGRKPVEEVYLQIHSDLETAEQQLPISYAEEEIGRATSGAAKALRGKVYLTQKDYINAKEKLKEVMELGVYGLLENYEDLWNLTNENSLESIFEVQFKKGGTGTGSSYFNRFAPKFSSPYTVSIGSGDGRISPSQNMEDEYEDGDLRKDVSMATGYVNGEGNWVPDKWVLKYRDIQVLARDADNNWPVLRYADVLLLYAEVLNEITFIPDGEAFEILNQIRRRAGLEPKSSISSNPNLKIETQEEFRLAIEHERRVELAFEGHRYFDLVRTNRFVRVMSQFYPVEEYQDIFPIPQSQIDINPTKIHQNPGYKR